MAICPNQLNMLHQKRSGLRRGGWTVIVAAVVVVGIAGVVSAAIFGDDLSAFTRRLRHSNRLTILVRNGSASPITFNGVMYAQPSGQASPAISIGPVPPGGAIESSTHLPPDRATLDEHLIDADGHLTWDNSIGSLRESDGPLRIEVTVDNHKIISVIHGRTFNLGPMTTTRLEATLPK
jgi:hypothetical protein